MSGHLERIDCLASIANNCLVTGGWDATLRVWDLSAGRCLEVLTPEVVRVENDLDWNDDASNDVRCVTTLADGRIVSGNGITITTWIEKDRAIEKLTSTSVARQRACADVENVIAHFL